MMAGRYATTVYNRQQRVLSKVGDMFGRAKSFHFTADKLLAEEVKIWESPDFRKLPAYERGYVRGMVEAGRRQIWQDCVIWMLGPASGPTRIVHSEWTEEMSELCRIPGALYGGHFWLDKNGEPLTDKPFTEYKPTNETK